jgi:hypothetical protein
VKTRLPLVIVLLPLLSACFPLSPEIPLHEVPADPLVKALEQRRQSFSGMKAVGRVETERKGRKRVYESVAILQQRFNKLRIEGHGPMGESIFALVWDGMDIIVQKAGESEPMKVGQFGFERVIGISLSPEDLCFVLTGNMPRIPAGAETIARCAEAGWCFVELRHDDQRWRLKVDPKGGTNGEPRIDSIELSRGDWIVFRSTFLYLKEGTNQVFPNPMRILLDNPDRDVSVTVTYEDADMNVPVEDAAFVLTGEGAER